MSIDPALDEQQSERNAAVFGAYELLVAKLPPDFTTQERALAKRDLLHLLPRLYAPGKSAEDLVKHAAAYGYA